MAQEKLFLVTHIDQGIHHLQTSRLILRNWKQNDIEPFAILNSDPRVCEFLPNVLSQEETLTSVIKIQSHFKKHAFGLFAVELISTKTFIGFVGLKYFSFDSHFTPASSWHGAFLGRVGDKALQLRPLKKSHSMVSKR